MIRFTGKTTYVLPFCLISMLTGNNQLKSWFSFSYHSQSNTWGGIWISTRVAFGTQNLTNMTKITFMQALLDSSMPAASWDKQERVCLLKDRLGVVLLLIKCWKFWFGMTSDQSNYQIGCLVLNNIGRILVRFWNLGKI